MVDNDVSHINATQGTQVVGRITSILKTVSEHMPGGTTTSEVARDIGISRPTVHRLLTSLNQQGFIDRDPQSGRWFLGPELYLIGHVAAERFDVTDIAREFVHELAEATGESAFFSVRRGFETVCLLREDGSFPIRSFVLYEGKRFPLGVASAGLAMLSFLPDEKINRYLTQSRLHEAYGADHAPERVWERIRQTRRDGYAENPALIVEGSWGMGATVFDQVGQPSWALSLTGIESRFFPDRRPKLGKLLLEQAHKLSQKIASSGHTLRS